MKFNRWLMPPLLIATLMSGCATNKEIYYWGEYENLIHDSYINPGSADPQTQIEKLNTDLQKAEALGKRIAPGIYAHLGFLYAMQGKESQSKSAFMEEQALYPESTTFISGMMERAERHEESKK
ncbi:MAG: DUF4810 domain-containing protein [Candidatus Polarisedimenticolaceae bacterium]|nr:DUF4810 domain-containing protein [Candidatus Polarisedimenticolaceae bacterium]